MEKGFYVNIKYGAHGVEFLERAGLCGELTLVSINGQERKMRKIHPYKTLKGAMNYIERTKRFDEMMGRNREFEIVYL